MSISLSKGQGISLSKTAGSALTRVRLGVGWDAVQAPQKKGFFAKLTGGGGETDIDLDASCVLYDGSGKRVDAVWFGQLTSKDGSVRHSGDNLTGEGDGDDESILVDLAALPGEVKTLVLTVSSFRGQTFAEVENAFARLVDETSGKELARYSLTEQGAHTGMIMASLVRAGDGDWELKALGERATGRTVDDLEQAIRPLL